jgi:hypothetical protein
MGVGVDEAWHNERGLYVCLDTGRTYADARDYAFLYADEVRAIRARSFPIEQRIRENPQFRQRYLPSQHMRFLIDRYVDISTFVVDMSTSPL